MVKREDKNFTRASRGQGRFFEEGKVSQALGDGEILKREEGSKGTTGQEASWSQNVQDMSESSRWPEHIYTQELLGLNYGAF